MRAAAAVSSPFSAAAASSPFSAAAAADPRLCIMTSRVLVMTARRITKVAGGGT